MRAVVEANEFFGVMEKVSKVIKRSVIPALETVWMVFDGESCELTATDLGVWLSARTPARGDVFSCAFRDVKAVLKCARFYDGKTTLEVTDIGDRRLIKLTCGERSAEFEGVAKDEIQPTPPLLNDTPVFTVSADKLAKRIERVSYAATDSSNENNRADCVSFVGSNIYAVDGYRLACDTDPALKFPGFRLVRAVYLKHLKLFGSDTVSVQYLELRKDELILSSLLERQEHRRRNRKCPSNHRNPTCESWRRCWRTTSATSGARRNPAPTGTKRSS